MNLTMTMTLDGLIRALRWKEHDLAERIERRITRRDDFSISPPPALRARAGAGEDDHDRRSR